VEIFLKLFSQRHREHYVPSFLGQSFGVLCGENILAFSWLFLCVLGDLCGKYPRKGRLDMDFELPPG
jgi:hypothetical protein